MSLLELTVADVIDEAKLFSAMQSVSDEAKLYGVTDGKRIGTFIEQRFKDTLRPRYAFDGGNAARGIDLPGVNTDIKVTSIRQPQSSSPFKSARQKVYGLGHHVLLFVYEKIDDPTMRTARLDMKHTVFIDKSQTGDAQTTKGLRRIIERGGGVAELVAFMEGRDLPMTASEMEALAQEVLVNPPQEGLLTLSNALQWRVQYQRAISLSCAAGP